ncbi:hypothetical protein GCM10022220_15350 [Actinocatenispora rupis]|uniref:Uncharacterized protein n=2 Tax=Actinocatenispora rupis TaxID=519421 RepID=A0A8J3IV62_9ACTN|nr:hypothetical protein Aru02nite_14150 [Actinocatenispora rupis]
MWWIVCRITGIGCGPLAVHDAVSREIEALAEQGVFSFRATVTFTWRSRGLTEQKLDEAIARYRRDACIYVSQRLSACAHRYPATQPVSLEHQINAELARQPKLYTWWGVPVSCHPELMIRMDPRVSAEISGPILGSLRQEYEHDQQMRWADIVDERSRHWSVLLEKLSEQPLIAEAAQLTNDGKLAGVLTESAKLRRTELVEVQRLLSQLLDNTAKWGYGGFEWVVNAERAVRHQLHELDIALEDGDADGPDGESQQAS